MDTASSNAIKVEHELYIDRRYNRARWAHPDNIWHDEYHDAWNRRLIFTLYLLCAVAFYMHLTEGVENIIDLGLYFLLALVLPTFVVLGIAAGIMALYGVFWKLPAELLNWLNGN